MQSDMRKRPADGGIEWHADVQAFRCAGCGLYREVREYVASRPDLLFEYGERVQQEHAACWGYADLRTAAAAYKCRAWAVTRERRKAAERRYHWRGRKAWLQIGVLRNV